MTTPQETVRAWLRAYGDDERPDVTEDFVQRFHREVEDGVPDVSVDPVLMRLVDDGARAQWEQFVRTLAGGEPNHEIPASTLEFTRALARRGLDLGALSEVHRVGQRAVWAFLNDLSEEIVRDTGTPRSDVVLHLLERVSTSADRTVTELRTTFEEARREAAETGAARRWQVISALMRGDEVDIDSTTRTLAHPLRGWHTAAVVRLGPGPDSQAIGSEVVNALAGAVPGAATLVHEHDERERWVWVTTRTPHEAQSLVAAVAGVRGQTTVALGGPAADVAGFHDSHLHAMAAACLAEVSTVPRHVVHFDEVELVWLLAHQPEVARILMRRELSALAADDPGLDRIRETLLAFLRSGGQVDATATVLGVHKNTVRNRLARAEQLLGRTLEERRSHLELALRYHAEGMPAVDRSHDHSPS